MKKLLKILIIVMLICSIFSLISFFVFDYKNVKNAGYNIVTHKNHKDRHNEDKKVIEDVLDDGDFDFNFDFDDDDYDDLINKGANSFAKKLTDGILGGVSDVLSDSFDDKLWMSDDSDAKIFGKYNKLLKTEKLGELNQLHIKSPYLFAKVVKSDEYKIEFYSQKESKKVVNNVDLKQDGKKCEIVCSEKMGKNIPCMIIHTPKPKNLKFDLEVKDGFFSSQETFKSAEIEMDDGVLNLGGKESYDIDIKIDDGIINMKFDNCDARVKVKGDSGYADILGKKHVFDNTEFEEKLKNSRDNIKVKIDSGFLNIR